MDLLWWILGDQIRSHIPARTGCRAEYHTCQVSVAGETAHNGERASGRAHDSQRWWDLRDDMVRGKGLEDGNSVGHVDIYRATWV